MPEVAKCAFIHSAASPSLSSIRTAEAGLCGVPDSGKYIHGTYCVATPHVWIYIYVVNISIESCASYVMLFLLSIL